MFDSQTTTHVGRAVQATLDFALTTSWDEFLNAYAQ
jgi:hypothetical protein